MGDHLANIASFASVGSARLCLRYFKVIRAKDRSLLKTYFLIFYCICFAFVLNQTFDNFRTLSSKVLSLEEDE